MPGEIRETYHAALQHDLVELPEDARLVGVVRWPTSWFTQVEENRPELGPPPDLLDEVQDHKEDLKLQGMCAEGAHNAAWEETNFADRYRAHLDDSEEARAELEGLAERVETGETVVLVCYEGEDKRCHRRILRDVLCERVENR